jgi:hypothetical protein
LERTGLLRHTVRYVRQIVSEFQRTHSTLIVTKTRELMPKLFCSHDAYTYRSIRTVSFERRVKRVLHQGTTIFCAVRVYAGGHARLPNSRAVGDPDMRPTYSLGIRLFVAWSVKPCASKLGWSALIWICSSSRNYVVMVAEISEL